MKSIQQLARKAQKDGISSNIALSRLASDEFRADMINTILDVFSKIPSQYSCPDDMRFCRDWDEPNLQEWNRVDLWKWFVSDGRHLAQVGNELESQLELGNKPTLIRCIQCAAWEEYWEVFAGVKAYLIEQYKIHDR